MFYHSNKNQSRTPNKQFLVKNAYFLSSWMSLTMFYLVMFLTLCLRVYTHGCSCGGAHGCMLRLEVEVGCLNTVAHFLKGLVFTVFLLYVCGCSACIYICILCVCSTHGGQKRAPDLLGRELHILVRCHVGAGTQTPVLQKTSQCSNHWATPEAQATLQLSSLLLQPHLNLEITHTAGLARWWPQWSCLHLLISLAPS